MADIQEKMVINRQWPVTDAYEMTTTISLPRKGVNKDTRVLLLARGPFLAVDSAPMQQTRQDVADQLNLVCIESSHYLSDHTCTPSPRHAYQCNSSVLARLPQEARSQWSFTQLVEACKQRSIAPILEYTAGAAPKGIEHLFFLQAADILAGLNAAMDILCREHPHLDAPVLASGVSYGANLLHICMAMWPEAFALLADDSSVHGLHHMMQPWKTSISINGITTYFKQDFSAWLRQADPGLFSPGQAHGGNGAQNMPPTVFFCAAEDKFSGAENKRKSWSHRSGCRVFTANKENKYLDGLFLSGRHAHSNRAGIVKKALEFLPADAGTRKFKVPESLSIKTRQRQYSITNPFFRDETLIIQAEKGED